MTLNLWDIKESFYARKKTVRVGEVDVKFRSSATIPRLYRIRFKRDIFKDLSKLEKTFNSDERSLKLMTLRYLKM